MRFRVERVQVEGLPGKVDAIAAFARLHGRQSTAGILARLAVSKVPSSWPRDFNILAIGRFVRKLYRYNRERRETVLGPRAAILLRSGDCDCAAALCCMLAVASRIPCRFAVGWFGGNARHIWAELRTQGGRWVPIDASTWKIEIGDDPRDVRPWQRVTLHAVDG